MILLAKYCYMSRTNRIWGSLTNNAICSIRYKGYETHLSRNSISFIEPIVTNSLKTQQYHLYFSKRMDLAEFITAPAKFN